MTMRLASWWLVLPTLTPLVHSVPTRPLPIGQNTTILTAAVGSEHARCKMFYCPNLDVSGDAFCRAINPGCAFCNIKFPVHSERMEYVCAGDWQGRGGGNGDVNLTVFEATRAAVGGMAGGMGTD